MLLVIFSFYPFPNQLWNLYYRLCRLPLKRANIVPVTAIDGFHQSARHLVHIGFRCLYFKKDYTVCPQMLGKARYLYSTFILYFCILLIPFFY